MCLQKDVLHRLEALSLMSRIAEIIAHIGVLQSPVLVRNPLAEFPSACSPTTYGLKNQGPGAGVGAGGGATSSNIFHVPSDCLCQTGKSSSFLNVTKLVGTLTGQLGRYFPSCTAVFPKSSSISVLSGKNNSLPMFGSAPPFHTSPVDRKWSTAPSNPGLIGTFARAYPARMKSRNAGSRSSYAMRRNQCDLRPQDYQIITRPN
jgi:hypothetical protein